MPTVTRKALGTVYLIMLMDMLNFGIVFPLVPLIAKEFGANATMVGTMVMSYSLCQFIVTTPLGRISDKYGRRPVLLVSVLGTTVSSMGTGLASNFYLVLLARCVNGLSGATVGVVNAYIADVTNVEERSVYMSYIQAANAIGMVFGPALGGLLSRFGFSVACYVSAAISAANLLVACAFLAESRPQAREAAVPLTGAPAAGDRGSAPATDSPAAASEAAIESGEASSRADEPPPRIPAAAVLLNTAGFLLVLAFASYESIMSYYLMDAFFEGDAQKAGEFYGELFTVVGVVMFIVSAFIYKPLLRCFGIRTVVILGTLIRMAGFIWQPFAATTLAFAAGLVVIVSGTQLVTPSVSALLTAMVPDTIYGRALSRQQASQVMARVVGPVILGRVYDKVDHTFAFHMLTVTTLIAGILISMVPSKYIPRNPGRSSRAASSEVSASGNGNQESDSRLPGKVAGHEASSGAAAAV